MRVFATLDENLYAKERTILKTVHTKRIRDKSYNILNIENTKFVIKVYVMCLAPIFSQ